MEKVFALLGVFAVTLIVALLGIYIISNIADLYEVPFVKDLTLTEMWGLYFIIKISGWNRVDREEKEDNKWVKECLTRLKEAFLGYLFVWASAHVIYQLL